MPNSPRSSKIWCRSDANPVSCNWGLSYGIEHLGFGKVTWYLVEVPDRNIGVPPVRKYANYRTLQFRQMLRSVSVVWYSCPQFAWSRIA
jgi:hypothetical protein